MEKEKQYIKKKFDIFLEEIFIEEIQKDMIDYIQFIEDGNSFGIDHHKNNIFLPSIEGFKKKSAQAQEYLMYLKKYDYEKLSDSQKIEFNVIQYILEIQ